MRIIKSILIWVTFLVFCTNVGMGQNTLPLGEFMAQLKNNHPIAKQGQLKIAQSEAGILAAKGGFDPTLQFDNASKTLNEKNYYIHQNTELKYLSPFGLQLKAGQERNNGQFINPENTVGALNYFGLSVPLLKGLLMDNQRAALKQARLFRSESEQEQKLMLNDLYLSGLEAYLDWAGNYKNLQIISENLKNAQDRLALIIIAHKNGDRAAADTLEAQTQVQNMYTLQLNVQQDYNTSVINLSNFLWSDSTEPYILNPLVLPDLAVLNIVFTNKSSDLLSNLDFTQPEIGKYKIKIAALNVDRRLKYQYMLPQANLQYNILNADNLRFNTAYSPYLANNYKFGFEFKMPLFIREARGDYQKVNLKIKEAESVLQLKNWELKNKIRSFEAEMEILKQQLTNIDALLSNYKQLLGFENIKLAQGESTLFLINSRENKVLESELKLQELKVKYQKTMYKQMWVAGSLDTI